MSFVFRFLYVFTFFACFAGRSAEDIVGCGGFVKSQFSVNLSKVFIKLYTKQGTLKESSDCAPTNGYYFIPIYDKGDYTLKIEAPPGWHFKPETVPLTFDGMTDPCSKGTDINFQLEGFAIKGQVVSRGRAEGPSDILVNLLSEKDRAVKEKVKTREGGAFEFAAVEPGSYIVRAEADTLSFDRDSARIDVNEGNVNVPPNAIVVAGYDIVGEVSFGGEPMKGVNFLLYGSDEKSKDATVPGCSKTPLPELREKDVICHVVSDDKGRFKMSPVPPGNYRIQPHYVKFDVQPRVMNVEIKHSHVLLADKFLVKGFSVSGRVMTSPGGKGIGNAEIHLNGEMMTLTDKEGLFNLDSMEPGSYVLRVHSEALNFPEVTVQLSPNKPEIEAIYPSEFRVCGTVTPSSGQSVRVVEMRRKGGNEERTEVAVNRETGAFCHFLSPGTWVVSVKVSDFEKSKGIQFLPANREIVVRSAPVNEVEFSQLRGKVIGNIVRLPAVDSERSEDITVKLKAPSGVIGVKFLGKTESSYEFVDVMPGFYDVEVHSSNLCFESQKHPVSVTSSETIVPHFIQSGFKAKIMSSHATSAFLRQVHVRDKKEEIRLEKGENVICLPSAGEYELEPFGCHGFEKDFYAYDPRREDLVKLIAVTHEVSGYVTSSSSVHDLYINVSHSGGPVKRIGPLKSVEESGGVHKYTFSYKTKDNQLLNFTPASENIIFQPESMEYRTRDDCSENAIRFAGEKGLIVEGRTEPPLSNVRISLRIVDGAGNETHLEVLTKADGKYKFGPLSNGIKYELTAAKESYVFAEPDANGIISAHKLAEINVVVLDSSTTEPLQGVLLSLTGGEKYRKNSMTGEDGTLSFHSLSPGEYFLRPVMKEYKFEPSSRIIQVKEGVTEQIELKGRRVSYSAYGMITSLNGEGESSILVEAVGIDSCSNLQEETISEGNGQFRIRGLLPQCEYHIRLKADSPVNARIDRITPTNLIIKANHDDVRDIRLIAFQLIEHMDLSVHVESTIPEHLKTLRLKLCREEAPDSPVHTVKLDTLAGGVKHWGNPAMQERFLKAGLLVQLPFVLRDNTPYFIQLDSTLNKHTFSYDEPVIHFVADKTYRNFKLLFEPVPKALDHEFSNSNYFILPLLAFVALLYTYSDRVAVALQGLCGMINAQKPFAAAATQERVSFPESSVSDMSIEPVPIAAATKTRKMKARKT